MTLRPTPVSTGRFTYSKRTCTFSAEASDLPQPGRVFDDACDVGYTLVSERTGAEVVFAESGRETDSEGDLLWTEYEPVCPGSARRFKLRIFND